LVYFDFNSSFLNEKSKVILDGLVLILKENPEMRVKVPSHTDPRGESDYNKWLSERRVQSTVAYLLSKGIQNERLIEESFGEEKLLNDCDDSKPCSEDEHKINRRSEFIIIEF
jgi:outer membrane protein OmpA-like peptidoglycan-associated protein